MNKLPSSPTPLHRPRSSQTNAGGFNFFRAFQTSLSIAFVMATLFTLWIPANLFGVKSYNEWTSISEITPNALPTTQVTTAPDVIRIGIIAGHSGIYNDPGATCPAGFLPDNLENEAQVNARIATLVQGKLVAEGYVVDLLDEFDSRLNGYNATVLVSIHNDSCSYINDEATGFKVAPAIVANPQQEKAERLTACLIDRYQKATSQDPRYPGGMNFHYNTITPDMTYYHAFYEISPTTTAAIIETGFLNLDREILTQNTDIVAEGINQGILCYLRNESISTTTTP
jgi:N-acetylmuramoyl-L-alanine amidase